MNVTSCIAVFSTCLFSQLEFNFSRPNPSWCHLTSWSCILTCSCTARCRYLHWKLMAFCPLRWLHFHNLKQRGDHKQLVSNHFIDLKHAHMAVCFSFCLFFSLKKLYHCFVEKYRRNVEMEQDSNIQIPVQFFCPLREDEAWCADKCLSASTPTAWCSGNRSVSPVVGKHWPAWIVYFWP